jgi:hypothetical protein
VSQKREKKHRREPTTGQREKEKRDGTALKHPTHKRERAGWMMSVATNTSQKTRPEGGHDLENGFLLRDGRCF